MKKIKKMDKKIDSLIPQLKLQRSKELFEFIKSHKSGFNEIDIDVTFNIFKTLEGNKISSIVIDSIEMRYIKEPDIGEVELVIEDKTNYDIFNEIDLYTHTMNVVDELINYIYNECDYGIVDVARDNYFKKTLITAIGYNIEKILRYGDKIPESLRLLNLSKKVKIISLYLRKNYPELDLDIIDGIEYFDKGSIKNYTQEMVIDKSKKARRKELQKWLIEHKNPKPQGIGEWILEEFFIDKKGR